MIIIGLLSLLLIAIVLEVRDTIRRVERNFIGQAFSRSTIATMGATIVFQYDLGIPSERAMNLEWVVFGILLTVQVVFSAIKRTRSRN